jgi:hypothetical protein
VPARPAGGTAGRALAAGRAAVGSRVSGGSGRVVVVASKEATARLITRYPEYWSVAADRTGYQAPPGEPATETCSKR